jgi:hypothetical protein
MNSDLQTQIRTSLDTKQYYKRGHRYPAQAVIRIRKSKKNRQHNDQKKKVQKDKQRSTKHTHKKLKIE